MLQSAALGWALLLHGPRLAGLVCRCSAEFEITCRSPAAGQGAHPWDPWQGCCNQTIHPRFKCSLGSPVSGIFRYCSHVSDDCFSSPPHATMYQALASPYMHTCDQIFVVEVRRASPRFLRHPQTIPKSHVTDHLMSLDEESSLNTYFPLSHFPNPPATTSPSHTPS